MKNLDDVVFIFGIFLCILLFAGEPDLMDAIIYALMEK